MNMKGGVGKTTLCLHLAGAAAYRRKRVLIIDYDPQYNLTQHLLTPKDYFPLQKDGKTIYGVLTDQPEKPNPFEVIISNNDANPPKLKDIVKKLFTTANGEGSVDIIPGSSEMMYLVLGKVDKSTRPMEQRFHKFLDEAEKKYDYVFIDCHPAGSFMTKSALVKSDLVVTPVVQDTYSQRGLALMNEFLAFIAKFSTRKPEMRIIFNMIPWSNANRSVETAIRNNTQFSKLCIQGVLHYSGPIAKSGSIDGPSWKRLMQWSGRPWSARVKAEVLGIFDELLP